MYIYLDTNLWNYLCDQGVDPEKLVRALRVKSARLILSPHVVFELAKTYQSGSAPGGERGKTLFKYLRKFVGVEKVYLKDSFEILAAETWALKSHTATGAFLGKDDQERLRDEVERLTEGELGPDAEKYIREHTRAGDISRSSQVQFFEDHPTAKSNLKKVKPDHLPQWIQEQVTTTTGRELLLGHLQSRFPEAPAQELAEYAVALQASTVGRVSKGLICADLYYNWRCAHRGSNPRDLTDDMYHVLNASYCDLYATREKGQTEYASLLLPSSTKVAVWDARAGIDEWLLTLA